MALKLTARGDSRHHGRGVLQARAERRAACRVAAQSTPEVSSTVATTLNGPTLLAALAISITAAPAAAQECGVSGSAADTADVSRARAACESARARFRDLFGSDAPSALIVLHDAAAYEVALAASVGVVFWPNSRALGVVPGAGAGAHRRADAHWREVLPHEVMHALAMAHFYADADATSHGGYGTPLPDWFEEGVAIWAEPDHSRHGRLAQARRLPPAQRDLVGILRGVHPVAGNAMLMAPVPGSPIPADDAVHAFYPQAIAVVAFVHHHGGARAMRELGRRLRSDPGMPDPLLGLPGLPGTGDELAAAWHRWMHDVPAR
jgi:hypothetical protein